MQHNWGPGPRARPQDEDLLAWWTRGPCTRSCSQSWEGHAVSLAVTVATVSASNSKYLGTFCLGLCSWIVKHMSNQSRAHPGLGNILKNILSLGHGPVR